MYLLWLLTLYHLQGVQFRFNGVAKIIKCPFVLVFRIHLNVVTAVADTSVTRRVSNCGLMALLYQRGVYDIYLV